MLGAIDVAPHFQVEEGLGLVTGGDPNVESGFSGAGFEDGIESIGFGGADLAGFFPEAEDGLILEPAKLGREKPGAGGKRNFGVDGCGLVRIRLALCFCAFIAFFVLTLLGQAKGLAGVWPG